MSAAGCQDREIARRLTAEGFRSARRDGVPLPLVGEIRRAHRRPAPSHQLRAQARVDGRWTVWGLSHRLHVARSWVYHQIAAGRVPAIRHAATGYYLIPEDPALLSELQARAAASGRADSRR